MTVQSHATLATIRELGELFSAADSPFTNPERQEPARRALDADATALLDALAELVVTSGAIFTDAAFPAFEAAKARFVRAVETVEEIRARYGYAAPEAGL